MDENTIIDCIGKSEGRHVFTSKGIYTLIDLDSDHMIHVRRSFDQASSTHAPDQILIEIENVRGTADANILNVSVNQQQAGFFSLYGLGNASQKENGGKGLTFTLDISQIIKNLDQNDSTDKYALDVHVYPQKVRSEQQDITIEKINIYRIRQKL
jgi:tyrosinase